MGIRAIARHLDLSRVTVRRFLAAEQFPERATRSTGVGILDPYKPYLQAQVAVGIHNARHLVDAIRAQGYTGSASLVRTYVGTLRVGRTGRGGQRAAAPPSETAAAVTPPAPPPPPRPRRLSARQAAWLLIRPAAERTPAQQEQVERLLDASADLATAHTLAQDFGMLIRQRHREQLDGWIVAALRSGVDEVASFARGLQ